MAASTGCRVCTQTSPRRKSGLSRTRSTRMKEPPNDTGHDGREAKSREDESSGRTCASGEGVPPESRESRETGRTTDQRTKPARRRRRNHRIHRIHRIHRPRRTGRRHPAFGELCGPRLGEGRSQKPPHGLVHTVLTTRYHLEASPSRMDQTDRHAKQSGRGRQHLYFFFLGVDTSTALPFLLLMSVGAAGLSPPPSDRESEEPPPARGRITPRSESS